MIALLTVALLACEAVWAADVTEPTAATQRGSSVQAPVGTGQFGMPDYTDRILTPPPKPEPQINGPTIFGVRPGHPFLYTVSASGQRPMTFSAQNLPAGLKIDESTGRITGAVSEPGRYTAILGAKNALGHARREFRVVVGSRVALTPPMGCNTWNAWGSAIDDEVIRKTAKAVVDTGLVNHGWTYVNIDDGWQGHRGGAFNAIQGNRKFPDMQALSDYVHGLGLKIGVYSTAFMTSYQGGVGGSSDDSSGRWDPAAPQRGRFVGKYMFDVDDARQWAAWGVDYLKYDWWIADLPNAQRMRDALDACGRDIVYSIVNGAGFYWTGVERHADSLSRICNAWRTTKDIVDTWDSVEDIGFSQYRWTDLAGPGHWNDADMLVIGKGGWGRNQHPTRLTPDEQYTHISLWSLLNGPLLIGCNLMEMDGFTISLLTNDEVIAVNQDALGRQATKVFQGGDHYLNEVWAKAMEDGSVAAGLFNLGPGASTVAASWKDLGICGKQVVRDLWRQVDIGTFEDKFEARIPSHGCMLVQIRPAL
jgi:alpha-galactosidase